MWIWIGQVVPLIGRELLGEQEAVLHGTEYIQERSSEAPVCDPDRNLSKEGFLA